MSGNARGASSAFCLLFRLGQLKPSDEDVQKLLDHSDSPFIRAVRASPAPPLALLPLRSSGTLVCAASRIAGFHSILVAFGMPPERRALPVLVAVCSMPTSSADPAPPTATWWQGACRCAPDCLPAANSSALRPAPSLPPQAETDNVSDCRFAARRHARQHPCRHSQLRQRPAKTVCPRDSRMQPATAYCHHALSKVPAFFPRCRRGASPASAGTLAGAPWDAVAPLAAGVPHLSGAVALLAVGLPLPAVRGESTAGLGLVAVLHRGPGGAAPPLLLCACVPSAPLRPQVA